MAAVDALLARAMPRLLRQDYAPAVLQAALPHFVALQPGLLASGRYSLACDRDGAVVGAAGWAWTAPQGGLGPPDMGHMRHLVTHHRHLRQGIARRLMGEVLTGARAAGVGRLDCLSTLTALPFYRAMGFATIGAVEVRLGPGLLFPAVHMRRSLAELP
nr:GNAT family N-acetyltransferase [Oceaniglobus trochenteri]